MPCRACCNSGDATTPAPSGCGEGAGDADVLEIPGDADGVAAAAAGDAGAEPPSNKVGEDLPDPPSLAFELARLLLPPTPECSFRRAPPPPLPAPSTLVRLEVEWVVTPLNANKTINVERTSV